jgi:hypothetical protein
MCLRHSHPERVLSPENTKTITSAVIQKRDSGLYFEGLYGVLHGLGYMAYAADFPEGTSITVTAEITLPPCA